ncbi:methyltransferase family protein [Rhodovulum bhavnagarense]|uniref:Methyltransferase family protein n=1 Tax=Rhodovulum bhavnagarense TaxID=992286 RepID=A0A4R2RJL4_9RHOB|nr:methyltransferase domain-containing protein [Rhodovulum bhavnagarense]TCP63064.1 methyltransferase family protein [Rhodovulum bhavnagarense]
MHLDVLDLRNFYYRTNLGRVAQRAIRDRVVDLWPEAKGQTVVGFGFAVPLLRPFLADARRVIGLMPGQQGVMPWPAGQANVSVLCEETSWPLQDGFVDKLVLLHGLETSENPSAVLAESARVLGPGGRALFIVPNRSGLWARRDGTPFGFGRPYSPGQLEAQLRAHGFEPQRNLAALFAPPTDRRFWLRSAGMWENAGRRMSAHFAGGVLLVEATKRPYRPTGVVVRDGMPRPLRVLDALPQPGAEPA